jgi:hypothetical protein
MATQAEAFVAHAKQIGLPAGEVVRDRDAKYSKGFDLASEAGGARVIPAPFRAPNVNAYVERFVQAIGSSALLPRGAAAPREGERAVDTAVADMDGDIMCSERLGGPSAALYYRRAA